jgi:hypothetical protein
LEDVTSAFQPAPEVFGPLAKGTLLYTSSKTSNANTKLFLDSSFHDVDAKLTDMQIFSGKDLPFSVDVPFVPVKRNSLPAITILLRPTLAKVTASSMLSVSLISSPLFF